MDKHIAEMTVRETLAFSADMMGQGRGNSVHASFMALVAAKEKEMGITPDPKLQQLIRWGLSLRSYHRVRPPLSRLHSLPASPFRTHPSDVVCCMFARHSVTGS